MTLVDTVRFSKLKLARKVSAYQEAYIFYLEAEILARRNLAMETPDNIHNTIQGSYLRLFHCVKESGVTPAEYYRGVLFVDLISSTEQFFSELLKAVFIAYPKKIGNVTVGLAEIIDGTSTAELVERCADEQIYRLMYEKPEDYLKKLCQLLSVDFERISPYWPTYIEAKARRDIGVHNEWICNATYFRKTSLLGEGFKVGDKMVPADREYCSSVVDCIISIASEFVAMLEIKYS